MHRLAWWKTNTTHHCDTVYKFCWRVAAASGKSADPILHCKTPLLKNLSDAMGDFNNCCTLCNGRRVVVPYFGPNLSFKGIISNTFLCECPFKHGCFLICTGVAKLSKKFLYNYSLWHYGIWTKCFHIMLLVMLIRYFSGVKYRYSLCIFQISVYCISRFVYHDYWTSRDISQILYWIVYFSAMLWSRIILDQYLWTNKVFFAWLNSTVPTVCLIAVNEHWRINIVLT
jgi:hypothetical protein